MAIRLPDLAPIDYTSLDFQSIVDLVDNLVKEHPDYFANVDDFLQSNAGRMTVELVAYVVDLLAERLDWVANELTLPTVTQKQNLMNLLKLINYRLTLPKTASTTVRATITNWIDPFVISGRYRIPAKDLNGNTIFFELLNKDDTGKYVYEGVGSGYEFDSGFQIAPVLEHTDLVFYEGTSYSEFFTMTGVNNEFVQLAKTGVEEGSIRVWKVTRNLAGEILTRRELTNINSFISPEAQTASALGLPPFKIQNTESNGVYLVFGETPVVAVFSQSGTDEILVWYRTTSASVGNITANSINYTTSILVNGQSVQISFLNLTSGSGGEESETTEHAKRYGPLSLTTVEKTVSPQDFVILLQEMSTLLNSIAYGKSNEPSGIFDDYGYYIPPYETWIYPVYNKPGWENFPTYSYPVEMRIGRPYTLYGYLDSEKVIFSTTYPDQILTKIKLYAHSGAYANIRVSDYYNQNIYTPGADYVIDLDARQISRIDGGSIDENGMVVVQYFESDKMDESYVLVNFATGDEQDIPQTLVYPGLRTYAITSNLTTMLEENTLSEGDYDWPTNDYYIDYANGKIVRKTSQPYLDSKTSFPISVDLQGGINNKFILTLDGLNREVFNADHDITIDCFNGWARMGNGFDITYVPATAYSFKITIDGGAEREYNFTPAGSGVWTVRELALEIWNNAVDVSTADPFYNSGAIVFADSFTYPAGPILTFMSLSTGVVSSIELASGGFGIYSDLFTLDPDLGFSSYATGNGETLSIFETAFRVRCALNSLGLCNGFAGQELPVSNEEKPEIYSKSDLKSPATFTVPGGAQLTFYLGGTASGTFDGSTTVALTSTIAGSPYDLTTYQGRMDLTKNLQDDIDGVSGYNQQDVISVMWLRIDGSHYRIGFRLIDTGSTTTNPSIKMEDDTARVLFQFVENQSSSDDNLVEALVSPESDMTSNNFLRLLLLGASGSTAKIQVKANTAVQNNTLELFGYTDMQYKIGSSIPQRVLPAENDLIADVTSGYLYTVYDSGGGADQNDRFNLNITSAPVGFSDGDYVITIPAGTYNISALIAAVNTAFTTADYSGSPSDISTFLKCEKVEGSLRIRFVMIDFDSTSPNAPDVEINDSDDATINKKSIDLLGFVIGQKMSIYSTIILHYAGNWISDYDADSSESTSIIKNLENYRLISQDYIIKDPLYTSFDVKGTVYVSKGFDRDTVKAEAVDNVREAFRINNREFQTPVAISSITDIIGQVEGVDYLDIEYFGKDYQLYKKFQDESKYAYITGYAPAENVVARWFSNSSFKIILDGCTVSGVNYDGEYLILVGNDWIDRDYDSLVNCITQGTISILGGLKHAIPLALGGIETDLTPAVHVRHNSGVITFYTTNEGAHVMLKLEQPEDVAIPGYQSFNRTSDVLESEYTATATYSVTVEIAGGGAINYEITAPTAGVWSLEQIAAQLEIELPSSAMCGIDSGGKIRITATSPGPSSIIDITSGTTGTDLLTLIGPVDTAFPGFQGTRGCLEPSESFLTNVKSDGALFVTPSTAYGKGAEPSQPTTDEEIDCYNYKTKIPSKYNEVLFVSDDYYLGGSTELVNQRHGLILEFVEAGSDI